MALCLAIEQTPTGASTNAQSVSGYRDLPWSLGPAVLTDGVYSCATGTHLLLTVEEVNAPPSLSVAPDQVAKAYGWGLLLALRAAFLRGMGPRPMLGLSRAAYPMARGTAGLARLSVSASANVISSASRTLTRG